MEREYFYDSIPYRLAVENLFDGERLPMRSIHQYGSYIKFLYTVYAVAS